MTTAMRFAISLLLTLGFCSAIATAEDADFGEEQAAEAVWWGNKAVSFRTYMKFEPIQVAQAPPRRQPPELGVIYFDLDKANLRDDGIAVANRLLRYMKANERATVTLAGHCCDLASDDYNMGLGQRRADAVKNYLVDHGIRPNRIRTVSYGETRRVTNDADKRPLNRRTEIILRGAGEPKRPRVTRPQRSRR